MSSSPHVTSLRKMLAKLTLQKHHRPLKSAPNLNAIPTELLFSITDWLGPESVMALSQVSCRLRFSLSAIAESMRKRKGAVAQLLLLLERDSPHLIACFVCDKLYNWTRSTNYACPNYDVRTHTRPLQLSHELSKVHSSVIDLIFRAERLGPEFGLPLSYFDRHSWEFSSTRFGVKIRCDFEARLNKNRLILFSRSKCTFDVNKDVHKQIAPLRATLCGHANDLLTSILLDTQAEISNLQTRKSTRYNLYGQNEFNCRECPTDMSVSILASSRHNPQFKVSILTFHEFNARTSNRLKPTIKFQNNSGIQNMTAISGITVKRYLRGEYDSWERQRTSRLVDLIQSTSRKFFRERVELLDQRQNQSDREKLKLKFWVCLSEAKVWNWI